MILYLLAPLTTIVTNCSSLTAPQVIADQGWTLLLGSAFEDQFRLYSPSGTRHPFCYRCIGVVLQKLSDSSYCYHKLEQLYARAAGPSQPQTPLVLLHCVGDLSPAQRRPWKRTRSEIGDPS